MPKTKRRLPQAETETISRPMQVSVEDGASSHEDDDSDAVDVEIDPSDEESGARAKGSGEEPSDGANDSVPDADDFRSLLQAELTADTIQHYLNRISVKPLLTVEEEQRRAG